MPARSPGASGPQSTRRLSASCSVLQREKGHVPPLTAWKGQPLGLGIVFRAALRLLFCCWSAVQEDPLPREWVLHSLGAESNLFNLDFDHVPILQRPYARVVRASQNQVAGLQGHVVGESGDHVGDAVFHVVGIVVLAKHSINPGLNPEVIGVKDLVRCRDEGPDGKEGIEGVAVMTSRARGLALHWEAADVDSGGVPEHVAQGFCHLHVFGRPTDDNGELSFMAEHRCPERR